MNDHVALQEAKRAVDTETTVLPEGLIATRSGILAYLGNKKSTGLTRDRAHVLVMPMNHLVAHPAVVIEIKIAIETGEVLIILIALDAIGVVGVVAPAEVTIAMEAVLVTDDASPTPLMVWLTIRGGSRRNREISLVELATPTDPIRTVRVGEKMTRKKVDVVIEIEIVTETEAVLETKKGIGTRIENKTKSVSDHVGVTAIENNIATANDLVLTAHPPQPTVKTPGITRDGRNAIMEMIPPPTSDRQQRLLSPDVHQTSLLKVHLGRRLRLNPRRIRTPSNEKLETENVC